MLMVITSSSCWSKTQQVRLNTLVNFEPAEPLFGGQFSTGANSMPEDSARERFRQWVSNAPDEFVVFLGGEVSSDGYWDQLWSIPEMAALWEVEVLSIEQQQRIEVIARELMSAEAPRGPTW
jgi:hypothetical protein